MDTYSLILFTVGAAAGGFINGLAGFGTAMFALGFWLQILPPEPAVFIATTISVITGFPGAWFVRNAINLSRLLRFVLPGLSGIPSGILLLNVLDTKILIIIISVLQISYGGFFIMKNKVVIKKPKPIIEIILGLCGGVLGGMASLSGALPTMWCTIQNWTKNEKRAVPQIFNIVILGLTAISLGITSQSAREASWLVLPALPVALISAYIGIIFFRSLSDYQFRSLVIFMIFLSGISLIIKSLISS